MNPLRPTPKIREIPALVRSSPAMFRDLFHRRYRTIPVRTIVGAVLGLVYLVNPLDLVPDALPLLGIVDDGLVFGLFLALLSRDVSQYLRWKDSSQTPTDSSKPTPPASH